MSQIKTRFILVLLVVLIVTMGFLFPNISIKANHHRGYGSVNRQVINVSLISLITNPEEYHEKLVRVKGVGNITFEANYVVLCKEHHEMGITKNGLWLDFDVQSLGIERDTELAELNGTYVLVEGVFNAHNKGPLDAYSGTIERVWRYDSWEDIVKWDAQLYPQ